jgi:purine-binding chemotaxis protein CheW
LKQVLSFQVGPEEYALEILRVREIKCWETPTRLPHTPNFVKGVINLRGEIVPLVCLREKFGLGPGEYGPRTVIVMVALSGERTNGLIVDSVSDVHNLPDDAIKPAPFLELDEEQYITGLAELENKMLIMLDIDKLLAGITGI